MLITENYADLLEQKKITDKDTEDMASRRFDVKPPFAWYDAPGFAASGGKMLQAMILYAFLDASWPRDEATIPEIDRTNKGTYSARAKARRRLVEIDEARRWIREDLSPLWVCVFKVGYDETLEFFEERWKEIDDGQRGVCREVRSMLSNCTEELYGGKPIKPLPTAQKPFALYSWGKGSD